MNYFVYVKPEGESRFSLANPVTLCYGLSKIYAPRFTDDGLDVLKKWVDAANKMPAATWQIRTVNGKKVYPK